MNNRKKLIAALVGTLLAGYPAGYSALAGIPHGNNSQPQSVIAAGNSVSDFSATELPGGNADYSVYEQYGLIYDKESKCYIYNGDVVRFFNDPAAGAGFTNFFTGTVDIEAERDADNNLIGIKACDTEVYDRHTGKHEKFASMFSADAPADAVMEAGDKMANIHTLREYEAYGISYNMEDGHWYYNRQRIHIFVDGGKGVVYLDDGGSIYLSLSKSSEDGAMEIKEVSETDAQFLMQNNISIRENYTTQE